MSKIEKNDTKYWLAILLEKNIYTQTTYNEALAYVRQHFMELDHDYSFLGLKLKPFYDVLSSDDLNVENEELVFECIRRWIHYNGLDPNTHLKLLLTTVKLSLLPIKYLLNEVEPYVVQYCKEVVLEELRYRLLDEKKKITTVRKYQNISLEKNKTIPNCEIIGKSEKPGMKLLSIGSDDLKTANVIEIFDNDHNSWTKPQNLAIYRKNYSVVLIDDKVMLIGGTLSSDINTEPLNKVQSLNLATGILSSEASLNDGRQYAAAVVVGNGKTSFLFILGGQGKEGDLDSVEIWSPFTRVWNRAQNMLNKRTGLAAIVLKNKIYVLGGRNNSNYLNTMEAYNLNEGKWETKASMKEERAHFCVTVFKEFLYAVAGSNGYQQHINTVEKYDSIDDSWITLANIISSGNVGISSLDNRLICAGGKNSDNVFEYDKNNNKWLKLDNLHVPRAGYLIELPIHMKDLKFDWDHDTTFHKLLMMGNHKSDTVCALEVYDDREDQWTRLKDLCINKKNYCVASVGENLLIIGGASPDGFQLNSVESLNLGTGKVSQIASLNGSREQSAAVVVTQEKFTFIYVFGGVENEQPLKSVERWDSSFRKWIVMNPMSVARAGHGVTLLKDEIYVVGGKTINTYIKTVEAYDFENDRWVSKASMNNTNAYFGITTFKNFIYVAGGNKDSETQINTVERYDPVHNVWTTIANISSTGAVGISGLGTKLICAGGESSNIVEEYDEENDRWKKISSMNAQCSGFLIKLRSDIDIYKSDWIVQKESSKKLIFAGGYYESHAKIVEIFDVEKKKWMKLKDLPFSRANFSVNIIDNKLLIIGGDGHYSNEVDAIDLSLGTITSLPPFKSTRRSHSNVVAQEGNKKVLYVIGGRYKNELASVEKWDPSTNEWTEGIPMTTERMAHGSVFLHGKIYVVGGYKNPTILNTVEAFDIEKRIWKPKASMKNKNTYFGIATFKDHIYVVGGEKSSIVERYDPLENSWTTLANIKSSGLVGICSTGDRLICAGGDKNSVEEYDVVKNEWISLPSMESVLHHGYLFELPEIQNSQFF